MTFSHRDHRVLRDLRRLALTLMVSLGLLLLLAIAVPNLGLQLLAVVGLGIAGSAYLWMADHVADTYRSDLTAVHRGSPVSAEVRVEVSQDVGIERERPDDRIASPHRRRPGWTGAGRAPVEPSNAEGATSPRRSAPP